MTPLVYHGQKSRITKLCDFPNIAYTDLAIPAGEERGEMLLSKRFTRLHRKGFLALVPVLQPHILQTLIVLSTYMGEARTCITTSKRLSDDLGISRDAARERLKALASVTIAGSPLLTVEMTRSHTYWPGQYHISFSPLVPVTCGGEEVRDEFWVKHFDEARALAKQLSPEAYVTLLALAIDMTETRTLRVPFQALAKRLGVSPSNAQKRITELCQTGVIRKLASAAGNEYYISDVVPLMFGAEDDPENWELEPQEIKLADITQLERLTCLDPHIKRRKELKERTTTLGKKAKLEYVLGPVVVQKPAIKENPLPFADCAGTTISSQWVERFGLERCQEVWAKAQGAKNPGGYMRMALEQGWQWGGAATNASTPGRFHLVDHTASMARAAEIAGITIDSDGPLWQLDKEVVKTVRCLAGV